MELTISKTEVVGSILFISRGRAEAARRAHNPDRGGSNPSPGDFCTKRLFNKLVEGSFQLVEEV